MNPIETLAVEHRLICQNLDLLGVAVQRLEAGGRPSQKFLARAVDFARSFTDAYHHAKEEEHLFIFLGTQVDGSLNPEIEALRYEHERGRELITKVAGALPGYVEGRPTATVDIIEGLAAYISLLRHHVHVEDHLFFPMARKQLGPDELELVVADFVAIQERFGPETFERCRGLVSEMTSLLDES